MGYEQKFTTEKLALGLNCRTIRKERKILQKEMLGLAQLRDTHISKIEHGKKNLEFETLYKLKTAFKVEISNLFNDRKEHNFDQPVRFLANDLATEKMKFSQRLTKLLKHRGVTQEDLSIMVRMGRGDISIYSTGAHNIALLTMVKIAMALKIQVYDLFDYEGPLPDNSGYKQEEIEP